MCLSSPQLLWLACATGRSSSHSDALAEHDDVAMYGWLQLPTPSTRTNRAGVGRTICAPEACICRTDREDKAAGLRVPALVPCYRTLSRLVPTMLIVPLPGAAEDADG